MACTVSCTKKNYETAVPLSVSEARQAEETDDTDGESENTEEREKFCRANQDAILCPVVVTQTKFGKKHEIQGDLREGRWATIEPALQAPNLEASPGQDLIQAFKSNLNLYCSSNSSSDMLFYCSKSGKSDTEAEDDDYNSSFAPAFSMFLAVIQEVPKNNDNFESRIRKPARASIFIAPGWSRRRLPGDQSITLIHRTPAGFNIERLVWFTC